MKKTNRMICLLLTALICVGMISIFTVQAGTDRTEKDFTEQAENIYSLPLFETSDIHGTLVDTSSDPCLYYLARIGDIVKDVRSSGGSYDKSRALLLDTGDIYQGNTLSILLGGNPLRAAFDKMDYDAVSIGNHEFDWKLDVSVDRDSTMADYQFDGVQYENRIPVVLSNFYVGGENQEWLNDYVILEKTAVNAAGDTVTVKVAVIGFAEDYSTSIKESMFSNLGYEIREDYDALNKLASSLETSGACDATVILSHAEAQKIADALGEETAVDLVLGGHTHESAAGKTSFGVPYMQPAAFGTTYATAQLRFGVTDNQPVFLGAADVETVSIKEPASLLYLNEENTENLDQEVVAVTKEALKQIQAQLEKTVGTITTDVIRLNNAELEHQRNCTAGNWICSIYARIVDAEIAFANRGAPRTDFLIPEGADKRAITFSDVYTMFPFGNPIYRYDITYAELLELINYAVTTEGKRIYAYVNGIDIYYDGTTINALVKDGALIYRDGEWIGDWENKTVSVAVNEYSATSIGESDGVTNPLVAWSNTDKLISNTLIDNENAITVLLEESKANNGYLYVDEQPHFISGEYTEPALSGDADGDGEVTVLDVTCIQRVLAEYPILAEFNDAAADADQDGEVTILDATRIQRRLADLSVDNNIGS